MKKIIRNSLLALIILSMLFVLTGCGSVTLTATQKMNANSKDEYTEKNVIEFKNDIADTIETTMTFTYDEAASTMYAYLLSMTKEQGNSSMKVKQDGKTITTTNTMKSYADFKGMFTEELTKEYVKNIFISLGYTVK